MWLEMTPVQKMRLETPSSFRTLSQPQNQYILFLCENIHCHDYVCTLNPEFGSKNTKALDKQIFAKRAPIFDIFTDLSDIRYRFCENLNKVNPVVNAL